MELKVLVIDDDNEGQMGGLIAKARKNRIAIDHVRNFEDGLKKLEQQFYDYQGVILDARCFPDKYSEENDLTDDDYIDANIQKVRTLTEKYKFIPHCIFTGYAGTFKKRLENAGFKVFSKGLENNEVIDFIIEGNKLERKYFAEHPEIMSLFHKKYLNKSYLTELAQCLERIKNQSHTYEDLKNTSHTVRSVMEAFYDALSICGVLPESLINDHDKNYSDCSKFLVGVGKDKDGNTIDEKFKAPRYIGWILTTIQNSSSEYMHNSRTNRIMEQSIYKQQMMIYSLFEVLLWFKRDLMDKHF